MTDDARRIVELEAMLVARDKTIGALSRRLERGLAQNVGAFGITEANIRLEQIIANKTLELERQRQALERALEDLGRAQEQLLQEMAQQRELELELRQVQKLEAVGRLAAGVAHEINTPVQFVNDSVHFVRDAMADIGEVLRVHRAACASMLGAGAEEARRAAEAVMAVEADADVDYLVENVPKALDRAIDGLKQVATIVRSMKDFAHPDQREMTTVDLQRGIESTLVIARNEYKYVADIETDFQELPPVLCHPGDVNQVILNIVVNAAHAIADVVAGSDRRGKICVRTRQEGDFAVIAISDTGGGIPEAIQHRIFDPFFTTKEVGRGTGQGLAISRAVIRDKHRGALTFETAPGKGTTFFIHLPIAGASEPPAPLSVRRPGLAILRP